MADIEYTKEKEPAESGLSQGEKENGGVSPEKQDDHDVLSGGVDDIAMVMKDGIRLHPQPTSDPLDPLNWSTFQKNCILAIVMAL